MCQFCHQHGEGKKWYLKAENYSEDLLSDLDRRRFIENFVSDVGNGHRSEMETALQKAMQLPAWLRRLGYRYKEQRYRRDHFGQVVPLEDLERVLDLVSSIVRLPCICRKNSTGATNARYCYGLSLDPEKLLGVKEAFLKTFRAGPDTDFFERLTKDQAMEQLRFLEKKGLVHTLWTFKTPFIGGLCNCDRSDCLAMVAYQYEFHLFFRGEYVGEVQKEKCIGCKACIEACQFGAIGYSTVHRKVFIDPLRCYGCGVCRTFCEQDAIRLISRKAHPLAARLW